MGDHPDDHRLHANMILAGLDDQPSRRSTEALMTTSQSSSMTSLPSISPRASPKPSHKPTKQVELYSVPPTPSSDLSTVDLGTNTNTSKLPEADIHEQYTVHSDHDHHDPDQHPPRLFPAPQRVTFWHKILYPTGVTPQHRKYEHWVGRIGFGAKGVVYGFVGGMTCASASRLTGHELNGSPQGAFILIGTFTGGEGLLVVMLAALMSYIAWRWWECFTFQGADATFTPFKNFFAYRLSPFISGCVYIAYSYYIIQLLANDEKESCYPECWRHSNIGKAGLVLFGVAFAIASLTQLLNTFTRKWHPEIDWQKCNKVEKWVLLSLGHLGFMGRSGLFLFVSILMFRALRGTVHQTGNTIANGVNQFIGTGAGRAFMFIFGFFTLMYGLFALLCSRYRHFPTPPPSGRPLFFRHQDQEVRHATRVPEIELA